MITDFEVRLRIILILFIFGFGSLWIRLFHLQVVQGDKLRKLAEANRTSILFERAPRGLILDRNGQVLADSRPTFVVLFTPLELNKEVFSDVVKRLSKILNMSEEQIFQKLRPAIKHSSLVRLMDRASRSIAFALAEQRPNLPGVSVVTEMQRRYPNGAIGSHFLGYLGQISPEEFQDLQAEGYSSDWLIGKMGLEKNYDSILRGEHGGMRIEVDASGRSIKILDRKETVLGYQLKTTIDLKIQKAAEDALAETGKSGAVVAVDPENGEILAYASAPSFDPNSFLYTRGEQVEHQVNPIEFLTNPNLPLYNRPIQGLYAPGSIFKIVVTAAVLENTKMDPALSFYCPGNFWLGGPGGKKFLCWKKKGHGKMDLTNALINSCNVYFYNLGLKVGPDAIETMAKNFGLGSPTGIEFQGEKSGLIPGRKMFKTGKRRWFDGDTLNMAIGQGTILFTPIQAAQMISMVANRGKLYRFRFVKEIRTPSGELYAESAPQILNQIHLSEKTWDFLYEALTRVVDEGTGQSCKISDIKVAGKTGTAQNPQGKDHAWFVAFAPVDDPKIAVSVLVEHGEHGASAAAPIAQKIIVAALSGSSHEIHAAKTIVTEGD